MSCARCDVLLNTRKWDPRCQEAPPSRLLPLLVTGTGGTGTHTIVSLLSARGILARHEDYGPQATVSWKHAVSDAYVGLPYPRAVSSSGHFTHPVHGMGVDSADSPRFRFVVHVVRCPLDAIASLTKRAPTLEPTPPRTIGRRSRI